MVYVLIIGKHIMAIKTCTIKMSITILLNDDSADNTPVKYNA